MLLLLRPPGPPPELSPPPADIAMVFESGSPKAATAPKPSTAAVAKPAPAPAPAPRVEPRAAPPAPAAAPTPPPTPPREAAARPVQPPAPAVPVTKPEAPRLPPAPARPSPVAAPRPVPRAAPPPPIRAPASPPALPPLRAPARPDRGRTAVAKFPAPMMRSFSIPSTTQASAHPFSRALADAEPAVRRGRRDDLPFDMRGAEQLGSDWSNAFMAWVDQHKHYPEQAIANDEDGSSGVQFTVDRYGRVKEVRLVERSGSVWLDMGLTGMFRDARLPPFPYGAPEKDVTITFTMHYILLRG